MKISDIITETTYVEDIRNQVLNYLTSLEASGMKMEIPTKKIVQFLTKLGYDIEEPQLNDVLVNTKYQVNGDVISINKMADAETDKQQYKRRTKNDEKKVNSMARQQIRRDM